MPELPEVETIRSGLQHVLPGKVITEVTELHPLLGSKGSFRGYISSVLLGSEIISVQRRGKLLVFELSSSENSDYFITCHLKMTGQLIWRPTKGEGVAGGHPSVSYITNLPSSHTRVVITFSDKSQLFFNDLRRFGYLELLKADSQDAIPFISKLGPEPLTDKFTVPYFSHALTRRKKSLIKPVLLDQSLVAGIGNIYADESLFRSGILPTRRVESLSEEDISRLFHAIRDVLALAIEHGGSSERDYVNAIGDKGTYLSVAQVYHRTGKPCSVCGNSIKRLKIAGRSSHFCDVCQV